MEYFGAATPFSQIAKLNIGSRPPSRKASQRLEDLRAIPWVFSWSQARAMLPGWYGFGAAAAKMREMGRGEELAQLYTQSRFFRTVISNLEMVLAKTDLDIARHYADLVEDQNLANGIFARIEAECKATHDTVLSLTGQTALLEHNAALAESIRLRLP